MTKTKLITLGLLGAGTLTLATGGLVAGAVYAQTTGTYPSIVQKIADTFNLDPSAVQNVFSQAHEEKQDERLDQLVTDGKLTQAQRDQLEVKQDEMHNKMGEIRDSDKTEDEKRTAIKAIHDEFKDWLEENNIDLPTRGFGHMRGHGRVF